MARTQNQIAQEILQVLQFETISKIYPETVSTLAFLVNEFLQASFLIKVTTTERDNLTPSEGLIVFDTTLKSYFGGNGTNWVEL